MCLLRRRRSTALVLVQYITALLGNTDIGTLNKGIMSTIVWGGGITVCCLGLHSLCQLCRSTTLTVERQESKVGCNNCYIATNYEVLSVLDNYPEIKSYANRYEIHCEI